MRLTGLQDNGEAMSLVLDQAMGTGLKPPVVLLGATLPQGLAADASNRVSSPAAVPSSHLALPLLRKAVRQQPLLHDKSCLSRGRGAKKGLHAVCIVPGPAAPALCSYQDTIR